MKTIAKIGIGFLLGILTAYLLVSRNSTPDKQEATMENVEETTDTFIQEHIYESDRHYFTIQMKNKEVELYVGMPKEEVRRVLGKPKSTDMMTIADRVHETWRYGYKYTNVNFINGKLDSVSQI